MSDKDFRTLEQKIRSLMVEKIDPRRNTKEREKVTNVGRPETAPDNFDPRSRLAKQGEIKTKIIDEADEARKMDGGKTDVDLDPKTDDRMDVESADVRKKSPKTTKIVVKEDLIDEQAVPKPETGFSSSIKPPKNPALNFKPQMPASNINSPRTVGKSIVPTVKSVVKNVGPSVIGGVPGLISRVVNPIASAQPLNKGEEEVLAQRRREDIGTTLDALKSKKPVKSFDISPEFKPASAPAPAPAAAPSPSPSNGRELEGLRDEPKKATMPSINPMGDYTGQKDEIEIPKKTEPPKSVEPPKPAPTPTPPPPQPKPKPKAAAPEEPQKKTYYIEPEGGGQVRAWGSADKPPVLPGFKVTSPEGGMQDTKKNRAVKGTYFEGTTNMFKSDNKFGLSDGILDAAKTVMEAKYKNEKELAAVAEPKDKITKKDVLVARGVIAKEDVASPAATKPPAERSQPAKPANVPLPPKRPAELKKKVDDEDRAPTGMRTFEEVEQIDEISKKTAYAAYAGKANDDYSKDYGEKLHGMIKKKWGDKAGEDAEAHASAYHWGRGGKSTGTDRLSGIWNRSSDQMRTTKSGKINKQDTKAKASEIKSRLGSHTKAKLPEEVEIDEASYSAKAAAAGKDIGKPGKQFGKIAASAAKRYGSKEAGERVAGAVLKKLREEDVEFSAEEIEKLNNISKDFE